MTRFILALIAAVLPLGALLADTSPTARIVETHIMPRFTELAARSAALAAAADTDCTADAPELRASYGAAFDAWVGASHLRFGPSETDGRAFALAFWPDPRGTTPRALQALIADQDPIATAPDA